MSPLSKDAYRRNCIDFSFGVGRIFTRPTSAFSTKAMYKSALTRIQREFTYTWVNHINAVLPYITILFKVYVPPTMDEIEVLRTTSHSLIRENWLLRRTNDEFLRAN